MIKRTWGEYGGKCHGCGGPNDPYMVKFELWPLIRNPGERGGGFTCLECAEKRLGRELVFEDFLDAPINYGVFGFRCVKFLESRKREKQQVQG